MRKKEEEYKKKCARHLKAVIKRSDRMPLLKNSENNQIPDVKGHLTREELDKKVKEELIKKLIG